MSSQFIPAQAIPKKGGSTMIIVLVVCACCCLSSSSAAGGFWTGYIPGTWLYQVRKTTDILIDYTKRDDCDHTKLRAEIKKEVGEIGSNKGNYSRMLKGHYLFEAARDAEIKHINKCGLGL